MFLNSIHFIFEQFIQKEQEKNVQEKKTRTIPVSHEPDKFNDSDDVDMM